MSEPEKTTDLGPIRPLMVVTAVVAGFIAVLTLMDFIYAVGYFHLVLLILALSYPTQTIGIMAVNFSIFNFYLLPVMMMELTGGYEVLLLVPMSILASFVYSIVLILMGSRLNRIFGGLSILINVSVIAWFLNF